MYDGAMSRYCTNDVIMCHGSNYGSDFSLQLSFYVQL
jgi:hypothetical protein